jgi:hypothetical protein
MRNYRRYGIGLVSAAVQIIAICSASGHDIYTGVHSKGHLCCNGQGNGTQYYDCGPTIYREKGTNFEFLTREGHWILIPTERIEFVPLPGDEIRDHGAHLCYRDPSFGASDELTGNLFFGEGQTIYLFCAFVQPQGF